MKRVPTLKYFERRADELREADFKNKWITRDRLILKLMKQYRADNALSWLEYRPLFDAWFNKYHNHY